MRFCVLFCVCLITVSSQKNERELTDDKAIQGKWKLLYVQTEPGMRDDKNDIEWIISHGRITQVLDGVVEPPRKDNLTRKFEYSISTHKKPKEIDMVALDGHWKKSVMRGIYKFEQGKLMICIGAMPSEERPAAFKTDVQKKHVIFYFERKR